tara:strand:+ start:52 stop:615 length:564 start_codon:yes stop_codon:yes gene_type:complete
MEKVIERLRNNTRKSAFNRQGYQVTFEVGSFHRALRFYSESINEHTENGDLISQMVPEFQRDNDKWSLERKIKFVENILCGFQSTIMLATINNDLMDDCFILDGLQRLTALQDWFDGKFPVYGDIWYKDLSHLRRAPFVDCRMSLVIHRFSSMQECVNFYIDINKGISHSEEDIKRATDYLEKLGKG